MGVCVRLTILVIFSKREAVGSDGTLRMKMNVTGSHIVRGNLIDSGELHGHDGFFRRPGVTLCGNVGKLQESGEHGATHKRKRSSSYLAQIHSNHPLFVLDYGNSRLEVPRGWSI